MLHSLRQATVHGVVLLLFSICLSFSATAFAQQQLMAIDDVKPGMKGIAKTVIQGTAIETFDVEVLSILKQKDTTGDMILVRVSGDVIDKTGGIAAGMSGSPVYIDGKLVGAIAYGWALTDRRICMVTPINEMLKLLTLNDDDADTKQITNKTNSSLRPLTTPIMVSGLGQHAMATLTEQLKPFDLMPVISGTAAGMTGIKPQLEPGSAMGVQLMRGDIEMSAIGTVTYRDGDNILGFGHPFLKRGNANYFLTTAYIHQTIPSLDTSFKLGATIDLVGTVNQDRLRGIGGVIGRYPHNIPLNIHVKDLDTNREKNLSVQVVQDEQLAPSLIATAAMQAIEQSIDRTGLGTSWVKMEITGQNLPGNKIVRENMFFNTTDIGAGSLGELLEGVGTILNNPFKPVEIMDIKLDIAVERAIQTAKIVQVETRKTSAKPGEIVPISVTLKPYRGDAITETVNFTVPAQQAPGNMIIVVRGGGSMLPMQKLLAQVGVQQVQASASNPKNLDEYLRDFVERDRNNELVAEIMSVNAGADPSQSIGGEMPAPGYNKPKTPLASSAQPPKTSGVVLGKGHAKVLTDYIIDGNAQLLIKVEGAAPVKPSKNEQIRIVI